MAALFTYSQHVEAAKCPRVEELMKKTWHKSAVELCSARKTECSHATCSSVAAARDYPTARSISERESHTHTTATCTWNLKGRRVRVEDVSNVTLALGYPSQLRINLQKGTVPQALE